MENQRNIHNEESHAKRLKHLEEFDEKLPEDLQKAEDKAKELMEIEQADKLQEEFDKFKLECDEIMQRKKNLIIEFRKELDFCKNKKNYKQCNKCKEAIQTDLYKIHIDKNLCNPLKINMSRCPFCHHDIEKDQQGFYQHLVVDGCAYQNNM